MVSDWRFGVSEMLRWRQIIRFWLGLLLLVLISIPFHSICAQSPTWRLLSGSPSGGGAARHDDVFFVNPLTGWVVNGTGKVYKTTDGGASWQMVLNIPGVYWRSIGFADSLKGWVGSLDSVDVLYSTTDGGATWNEVENISEPRPDGICGISVVNESVVYASGEYNGPARVIKTTDGGSNWTSTDLAPDAGALVDCHFFNADSGFVVGSTNGIYQSGYARILWTSNGGSTWQVVYAGTRIGELCWKISFPTRMIGYVSIETFQAGPTYFLKTTDGGMTWQEKLFRGTRYDVQGIGFLTPELGWIGGWGFMPHRTTDGGDTWTVSNFGSNVNRFRLLNDTLGYAVGSRIYKYSPDSTGSTGVDEPGPFPAQVLLRQNFPNPFNPTTTIEYDLARTALVELSIFDVLGRKVASLFQGTKPPGTHIVEWNGRDATGSEARSGVYFYRLNVDGFNISRKMLLLK